MSGYQVSAVVAFLLTAGSAAAQFTITDVVNAGNRIPSASASGGVAQGAIFIASGRGIGPAEFQQATFPLPTTDGLGGVSIKITSGEQTLDAIMVFVAPNEVAAILPSSTPLGPATITVNNNGVTATHAIKVVAAAFGIFIQNGTGGLGTAVAFNVNDDGSTTPNSIDQGVQPGHDVLINGTGLGAIPSDETQSGVTDVPGTAIQVWAGIKPATVVSAGRGVCCDGLPPNFRVPQGVAGWDVIRFTVPDDVVGCLIPVVVQIGNIISNLVTISIASDGAVCTPLKVIQPDGLEGKTGISLGSVSLSRTIAMAQSGNNSTQRADHGSATFIRYPNGPANSYAAQIIYPTNVCIINSFPLQGGTPFFPGTPRSLDAGPAITVRGPSGTRTIPRQVVGMLSQYQGTTFGNSTPGNFYDPGRYTISAPGGADVGAFSTTIDIPPTPFVWTNIPSVATPLDRSKDLTIKWTGGIPDTQVIIAGGSVGVGNVASAFLCAAPVSAGEMTVPAYVMLSLPPTGTAPGSAPGQLTLGNTLITLFKASGLDIASIAQGTGYTVYLRLQ